MKTSYTIPTTNTNHHNYYITCDPSKKYLVYFYQGTNEIDVAFPPHDTELDGPLKSTPTCYTWDIANGFVITVPDVSYDHLPKKYILFMCDIRVVLPRKYLREYSKLVNFDYLSTGYLVYAAIELPEQFCFVPLHCILSPEYDDPFLWVAIFVIRIDNRCTMYKEICKLRDRVSGTTEDYSEMTMEQVYKLFMSHKYNFICPGAGMCNHFGDGLSDINITCQN